MLSQGLILPVLRLRRPRGMCSWLTYSICWKTKGSGGVGWMGCGGRGGVGGG